MNIDGALQFTGAAGSVATDSPTTGTEASTNVLDLSIARDMGVGDNPALKLFVEVLTAFTGGTSLQVNLEGAPDNGSGAPGSYTAMVNGPVVAEANLVAGAMLLQVDVPRPAPAQARPRFLRLRYVTVGTHGAGALYGAIVLDRPDTVYYPAGVTIAN